MHWRVPLRRAMGRSRSETGGGGEGGGDKGAGTVAIGEEGDFGSEDGSYGRESEGGDTSGKGIEIVIGRSMTGVGAARRQSAVGCARWPGRATARQGNGRAATTLEGGGVAGTRRRRRDGARGSQGPPGRTTTGTRRRRRDRAMARRDANTERGRARMVARQGDGQAGRR